MDSHYLKEPMFKMGVWALLPADLGNWHEQDSSHYFKKTFGIYKGTFNIGDIKNGYQHAYFPVSYINKLHNRISQINKKDYRALSRILKQFYKQRPRTKKALDKLTAKNYHALTDEQLIKMFRANRDLIHRITIYDQFGWIAEHYWEKLMQNILVKKLSLPKTSAEYQRVLFALVKPEEISTTLEEKRAVLEQAIAVKTKKRSLPAAAEILAKKYGWMPVFTYGVPWTAKHYKEELSGTVKQAFAEITREEYLKLKNYTKMRNKEFNDIVKTYKIEPRDAQVFVDFGLALDARNEAEYVVSYGGYYLLPMYKELARRLKLTERQLRVLYEGEIVSSLRGQTDAKKIIKERGDITAMGFDPSMKHFKIFTEKEARYLFKHIEARLKKETAGVEASGMCASPGKVTGPARLVPTAEQNHKVKPGDILITYATTVDYLPAMKKAAAFITEAGGLTCHAAVVAREFGVPCIVSLRDAMKKFKDGQEIEVNATEGKVKILGR